MAGDHARARHRGRRWLLAAVAVPAVALGGTLGWPSDPVVSSAASVAVTTGVAAAAPGTGTAAAAAATTAATPPAVDAAAVLAAVDAAAAEAGGTISVVVLDTAGAQLVASGDAAEPEYTASLVKLLVVQQLLEQDADGTLSLDADDLALMERAVEASDDDAMNTLWVRFDGAELVSAAAAEFGLTGTAPPEEAGQWGESTTTAADYASFLSALGDHLDAGDLATLTGWMQSTTASAADGFDQDFGLLGADAEAGTVAAKQGWMCCVDSRRQLHSAGVLSDGRVVVLLGNFPTSTSWAGAQAALDASAAAVVSGS